MCPAPQPVIERNLAMNFIAYRNEYKKDFRKRLSKREIERSSSNLLRKAFVVCVKTIVNLRKGQLFRDMC